MDVVIPMGRVEGGSVILGFGVRSWGSVPGLSLPVQCCGNEFHRARVRCWAWNSGPKG